MCLYVSMILCGKKNRHIKNVFLAVLFYLFSFSSKAATVDTISIYSNAMNKSYKCVVIQPGSNKIKNYPVVYLLHGYSGNYASWIKGAPALEDYADQYQVIFVCPDGAFGSWYIDSPVDPAMKFETYVGTEIPAYIDSHYPTIKDRKARAITGLSMGGHGGLFLGFRHAGTFGACGSMSGGVDLRPFPKNWQLSQRLGDTLNHEENWKKYSVTTVVENKPSDSLAIIIDCGTEDFFYTVNKNLHQKLMQLKIPHEYTERPGQHNWDYWRNAVQHQLLFFKNYFEKMQK